MDVCLFEGAGGDDAGAASSGERVLEDPGEFGVAVGHVFCRCGQCRYHVTKAGEGKIDLLGLLEVLAFHSALSNLFATCQVDEAQLGSVLLVVTAMDSVHEQNGVAPRRTVIIVSAGDLPILVSKPDQIHDFQMILHLHLHQSLEYHRVIQFLQTYSFG